MASWLTELYLDQINRALLDAGADQALATSDTEASSPTADDLGKQLQSFLATHLEARTRFALDGEDHQNCQSVANRFRHYARRTAHQSLRVY